MPQSTFKKKAEDTHYLAFQQAVMTALKKTEGFSLNDSISVILDDDEKYSLECYKLLNKIKINHPEWRRRITGICFVDDRTCPPVQAADMISYCTRDQLIARPKSRLAPMPPPNALFRVLTIRASFKSTRSRSSSGFPPHDFFFLSHSSLNAMMSFI